MANGIRVRRNFKLAVPFCVSPVQAREAGLQLLVQIENRTLSGRDETGHAFKQYSERYGYGVKGSLRPVDLKRSGDMLRDTDVVVATPFRIALGFRTDAMAQRARYHDSLEPRRKMPLRRFLGVQESWVNAVVQRLKKGLTF